MLPLASMVGLCSACGWMPFKGQQTVILEPALRGQKKESRIYE